MKALYFKELRQGRPLLVFGLVMGLLIAASYAVLARAEWFGAGDHHNTLDLIFGVVILVPIPLIALLAGAGLFSVEVERSTAPVLLSLPVSRRGIWSAKLLAGLTLTALSALLVLAVAVPLMPRAVTSWTASALLPDCYLSSLTLFAIACFCSALAAHTVAAIILSVLLGALLTTGAAYLYSQGGSLLGYDAAFDMELWVCCAIPALLLSGALAIIRGELLQSWHKWASGLVALAVAIAFTVVAVVGIARWTTRYRRSAVVAVSADLTQTGGPMSAITLLTSGDPVEFTRSGGGGWRHVDHARWRQAKPQESPHCFDFRSEHAVSLDARTGRELLVLRRPSGAVVASTYTRDGRFAAFALIRPPLTWGRPGSEEGGHSLAIYDLPRQTCIYSGLPGELREQAVRFLSDLRWSPSGEYLAVAGGPAESRRGGSAVYLMRRDGSLHRALPNMSYWAWSPKEDVVFGFDGLGALHRLSPEGEDRVVFQSKRGPLVPAQGRPGFAPPGSAPRPGSLAISPDGKRLAFATATPRSRTASIQGPTVSVYRYPRIHVMSADGAKHAVLSVPVGHAPVAYHEYPEFPDLLWCADGSALYVLATRELEDGSAARELFRWRSGDSHLSRVAPLPEKAIPAALYARPDSNEVAVSLRRHWAPPVAARWAGGPGPAEAAPLPFVHELVLLDTHDRLRAVPLGVGEGPGGVIGFDTQGRLLVVRGWRELTALDPDTGKATELYP